MEDQNKEALKTMKAFSEKMNKGEKETEKSISNLGNEILACSALYDKLNSSVNELVGKVSSIENQIQAIEKISSINHDSKQSKHMLETIDSNKLRLSNNSTYNLIDNQLPDSSIQNTQSVLSLNREADKRLTSSQYISYTSDPSQFKHKADLVHDYSSSTYSFCCFLSLNNDNVLAYISNFSDIICTNLLFNQVKQVKSAHKKTIYCIKHYYYEAQNKSIDLILTCGEDGYVKAWSYSEEMKLIYSKQPFSVSNYLKSACLLKSESQYKTKHYIIVGHLGRHKDPGMKILDLESLESEQRIGPPEEGYYFIDDYVKPFTKEQYLICGRKNSYCAYKWPDTRNYHNTFWVGDDSMCDSASLIETTNQSLFAGNAKDTSVMIWDFNKGSLLQTVVYEKEGGPRKTVSSVCLWDADTLLIGDYGKIAIYDISDLKQPELKEELEGRDQSCVASQGFKFNCDQYGECLVVSVTKGSISVFAEDLIR
mmetsp:Transcript_31615/g.32837  ORF Transcript_31615/g.32837 Transcript_31615/m.32837 type:complete len:482 (+) Transcript_31615:171-1616(+)